AAQNYADTVSARMVALSGLDAAPLSLRQYTSVTAQTQLWAQPLGLTPAGDPNAPVLRQRLRQQYAPLLAKLEGTTNNQFPGSGMATMRAEADLNKLVSSVSSKSAATGTSQAATSGR